MLWEADSNDDCIRFQFVTNVQILNSKTRSTEWLFALIDFLYAI